MSDEYMTSKTIDGVSTKLVFKCDPVEAFKRVVERIENKDEQMLHDLQMVMIGITKTDPDTITLTREELEGMKVNNHISDSEYNMALKDGHNYAIDAILEKM